jgi:DNA-directed RNA polymerase subunit K/omega
MRVFTPNAAADATPSSNKYEAVMVAAAYARKLNELPKEGGKEWRKKYTTRSLEDLVSGEIEYSVTVRKVE